MDIETLIVTPEEKSLRLDKLLVQRFPQHSRTYFQYLIEQNCVLVNGRVLKKRQHPKEGDEIDISFLLTPELSLVPENIPLEILYEDEHFLAVNKPPGMVVHPAPGHPTGTFANALLYHCKNLQKDVHDLRPGIVHRLDKDTSGVLLAAKNPDMHQKLVSLFSERKIEKYYLAICMGKPKFARIDAPIGRHPQRRQEMRVCQEKGKEAISLLKIVQEKHPFSLVQVQILTGRTHQIRVHLKHIGHPILGDPIYGVKSTNEKYGIARPLLHAHRIKFSHPFTSQVIEIEAPIHADIRLP
jgi:23S rRNA pseudouridine1911/1915/1917 synthase